MAGEPSPSMLGLLGRGMSVGMSSVVAPSEVDAMSVRGGVEALLMGVAPVARAGAEGLTSVVQEAEALYPDTWDKRRGKVVGIVRDFQTLLRNCGVKRKTRSQEVTPETIATVAGGKQMRGYETWLVKAFEELVRTDTDPQLVLWECAEAAAKASQPMRQLLEDVLPGTAVYMPRGTPQDRSNARQLLDKWQHSHTFPRYVVQEMAQQYEETAQRVSHRNPLPIKPQPTPESKRAEREQRSREKGERKQREAEKRQRKLEQLGVRLLPSSQRRREHSDASALVHLSRDALRQKLETSRAPVRVVQGTGIIAPGGTPARRNVLERREMEKQQRLLKKKQEQQEQEEELYQTVLGAEEEEDEVEDEGGAKQPLESILDECLLMLIDDVDPPAQEEEEVTRDLLQDVPEVFDSLEEEDFPEPFEPDGVQTASASHAPPEKLEEAAKPDLPNFRTGIPLPQHPPPPPSEDSDLLDIRTCATSATPAASEAEALVIDSVEKKNEVVAVAVAQRPQWSSARAAAAEAKKLRERQAAFVAGQQHMRLGKARRFELDKDGMGDAVFVEAVNAFETRNSAELVDLLEEEKAEAAEIEKQRQGAGIDDIFAPAPSASTQQLPTPLASQMLPDSQESTQPTPQKGQSGSKRKQGSADSPKADAKKRKRAKQEAEASPALVKRRCKRCKRSYKSASGQSVLCPECRKTAD